MRRLSTASLAFKKEKAASKAAFGANVINALSADAPADEPKPLFPNLPLPVSALQTVNDALTAAISAALTGNHTSVAALKNIITEWNNDFTLTAKYVSAIALGDETIIRKAGFVPTKNEKQPAQKPVAAQGFKATINGSKGAVVAGSKNAVADAEGYIYSAVPEGVTVDYNGNTMMITIGDKTVYINADTRKQTEFYQLQSGTPYYVSMFAFNRAGNGPAVSNQKVIPQ